ncbi:DUF938 domain-containing protein [Altericista sp. CCNU0014]|uniref:DUF938 domain-containing protein n=1 Tax=Altericista sp. CCNU0014 TaxID=3082949 RepID=UPI00384C03B5
MTQTDARQFAPATQRNREPILAVLRRVLPQEGLVLEIASGTGEHAAFLTPLLFPRYWLPSDADPEALKSIRAWQDDRPAERLLPPVALEVSQGDWPDKAKAAIALHAPPLAISAIANINMIHISPWSATLGLMAGAEALLPDGGVLYLYGPYRQKDVPTALSNEAFDASLRSRNPEWGLRNVEDVVAVAAQRGLHLRDIIPMPANNLSVVFERRRR